MNNSIPKISVLMSVYNAIPFLEESVESVLNQSFTNFEFIIIDDCSTDNSWEILSKYAEKDERIKLHKNQENLGLTKSLNKGLNLATGEYIARQDADDISLSKRFEKQVELLDLHPDYILASCDIELINAEGSRIAIDRRACEPELVGWYLIFYNHIAGHSQVMFRKEPVVNLGGYLATRRYSQDYELWCRLAKIGKMAILPEALVQQRRHSKSISADKKSEQEAYSLNQVRDNIKLLIGEEISLEEAKDLRGFWLGHWWLRYFPDNNKAEKIHSIIEQIQLKYLQQNGSDPSLSRQLDIRIGKQFLYWIQTPVRREQTLLGKLAISAYALNWCPLGIPGSWLRCLKNSLFFKLRPIAKLRHRLISKLALRSST